MYGFLLDINEVQKYNNWNSMNAIFIKRIVDQLLEMLPSQFSNPLIKAYQAGNIIYDATQFFCEYVYDKYIYVADSDLGQIKTMNREYFLDKEILTEYFRINANACNNQKHSNERIISQLATTKEQAAYIDGAYNQAYNNARDNFMEMFNETYYIPYINDFIKFNAFISYCVEKWPGDRVWAAYNEYLKDFNEYEQKLDNDENIDKLDIIPLLQIKEKELHDVYDAKIKSIEESFNDGWLAFYTSPNVRKLTADEFFQYYRNLQKIDPICPLIHNSCKPEKEPPVKPINLIDPIILDINRNGKIDTTTLKDGVYFDNYGINWPSKISWMGDGDAILVRDINLNGKIDGGLELFGDSTILENGEKAKHGFAALSELDEDGDGIIDKNDSAWETLRVWIDRNRDGILDTGELLTLSEVGIKGINVAYSDIREVDSSGNLHSQRGSFIWENGEEGVMDDVWLNLDISDTVIPNPVDISEEIGELPDLPGWGLMLSLHQAMARDTSGRLQSLIVAFINEPDHEERLELMPDILYRWYLISAGKNEFSENNGISEKKYSVVSRLWGTFNPEWLERYEGSSIGLNTAFQQWVDYLYGNLNLQTHFSELYKSAIAFANSCHLRLVFSNDSREDYNERYENVFDVTSFANILREYRETEKNAELLLFKNSLKNAQLDKYIGDAFIYLYYQKVIEKNTELGEMNIIKEMLEDWGLLSIVQGNDNSNVITANKYNNIIHGNAGNDSIVGGNGNDILDGGLGDDLLSGKNGDDVYIWGKGCGNDVIEENDTRVSDKYNVIYLKDCYSSEDIQFLIHDKSFTIKIKSTGETLLIKNGLSYLNMISSGSNQNNKDSIQAIKFADGTTWEWDDICKQPMYMEQTGRIYAPYEGGHVIGTAGNDIIDGGMGNNILIGGGGNDLIIGRDGDDFLDGGIGDDEIYGGGGSNKYVWGTGYGNDIIHDSSTLKSEVSTIKLLDLLPNDLEYHYEAELSDHINFIITNMKSGETLTIHWSPPKYPEVKDVYYGVDVLEFSDGSQLCLSDILSQSHYLYANSGNDYIDFTMNNITYVWGKNCGDDFIHFKYQGSDAHSRILLKDLSKDDIVLSRETGEPYVNPNYNNNKNASLVITIRATGERLVVFNFFAKQGEDIDYHIHELEFGDGTIWSYNDMLQRFYQTTGGSGDDLLRVIRPGNNVLSGGGGNDTYFFDRGDGHCSIIDTYYNESGWERYSGDDTLVFGENITPQDLWFSQNEWGDLFIKIVGTDDQITIKDGMKLFNLRGIEKIKAGGLELDITFAPMIQAYVNLMSTIGAPAGANGTWTAVQRAALENIVLTQWQNLKAPAVTLMGSSGDDILVGGDGDDFLYGNEGNDILYGGKGNDFLEGGAGDDIFIFKKGDGQDTVYDDQGLDELVFGDEISIGDLVFERSGSDLLIRLLGSDDQVTIYGWYNSSNMKIENICVGNNYLTSSNVERWIQFLKNLGSPAGSGGVWSVNQRATLESYINNYWFSTTIGSSKNIFGNDGDDILNGGPGDDSLYGFAGNDVLAGGAGNDFLHGGAGNDVFVFGRGDGHDTVDANDNGFEKRDIVRLRDLVKDDIEFIGLNGKDLVIRIKDTGETITILNGLKGGSAGIQAVEYGDGSLVEWRDIYVAEIYGSSGNDLITGNEGNDRFYGMAGDDTLSGGGGDDYLDGGPGNDILIGGGGDDIYAFGRGDGHDVVDAFDVRTNKCDTILLKDLNRNEVEFINTRNGDFIIKIKDTAETITVLNGMKSYADAVQVIKFGDGTVLNFADIHFRDVWGTDGNDRLQGTAADEVFYGLEGNDLLVGGGGNDVFVFGRGDGHDIVDAYDTTLGKRAIIRLRGITPTEVSFNDNRYGDFVITIKDTGETITVKNGMNGIVCGIQAVEFGLIRFLRG